MSRSIDIRDRFMEKVSKDGNGCWLWVAGTDSNGYGKFRISGKYVGAHRVSYLMFVGPIPIDMYVCHSCDIRACVNPKHLWIGTASDNVSDMHAKNRHPRTGHSKKINSGERNGRSKITRSDAETIRRLRASGAKVTALAKEFGLSTSTISYIARGLRWG